MFEVGDTVSCKELGVGKVVSIAANGDFPVKVQFSHRPNGKLMYTIDGKFYSNPNDNSAYDLELISKSETVNSVPTDLSVGSFGITSSMVVRITEIFSAEYRVCNLHSGGHSRVPKSSVMPLPDNITITDPSFEYILNEHKTKILATVVRTPNIDLIGIDGNYQILDKSPTI